MLEESAMTADTVANDDLAKLEEVASTLLEFFCDTTESGSAAMFEKFAVQHAHVFAEDFDLEGEE